MKKSFVLWSLVVFFLIPSISYAIEAKIITILGTADLQGMLEPQRVYLDLDSDGEKEEHLLGGIARIATLIKNIKSQNNRAVMISSGDDLMGRLFHFYKGKAIFNLLSSSGYDLIAPGNHEFDKGSMVLATALDNADLEMLCSDLIISNPFLSKKCKPYVIKELDGVKVGFFSLMTTYFNEISAADDVKVNKEHITLSNNIIKNLKKEGATVIVAITHQGVNDDIALAKKVQGIDLIFGGHSHRLLRNIKFVGNTAIVNGGEHGFYLVKVNLPIDNNGYVVHKKISLNLVPVDESVIADTYIENQLQNFLKALPNAITLGITEKPWDMRSKTLRESEADVADMINDLFRTHFNAQIALNNAGAFRGKRIYPAGNITDVMLDEIDQFKNCAMLFKLKGKYLKEILEHSAANYGKGGFLQVSGIRYKINLAKSPQITKDEKVIQKGNRVEKIEIFENGDLKPVDPEKEYTIISNSFLVERAGDGYFWFQKYGTDFENTYTTFSSLMACYLKKYGKLTPKGIDGRIEIIK